MDPISINWMRIPKKNRERVLKNSFCTNCRSFTRIVNYSIEDDYFGLIIQGKCNVCGDEIARVIER